jgi:hypothetical protein
MRMRGGFRAGAGRLPAKPAPLRVFLSHTGDLRELPQDGSFIAAAEAAVARAGHAVVDMAYFSVADLDPGDHSVSMVARADVYVGIIGLRYGAPAHGREDLSHTELEYETATTRRMPRLIVLLQESALPRPSQSPEHAARQLAFRRRLQDARVTIASVTSAHELELRLYQALVELQAHSDPWQQLPETWTETARNHERIARVLRTTYGRALATPQDGALLDVLVEEIEEPLVGRDVPAVVSVPRSTMADVYADAGNGLLILGDPGSGKTRLLYDLAWALLPRAAGGGHLEPLPVVLDLSSWGVKRLALEEWLVEELWLRYRIVASLARRWLYEGRLTPLLDGLDQVDQQARGECINAINELQRTWPLAPVVCCRRSTYLLERRRLTLQTAVQIRPLTSQQVTTHLERLGRPVRAVLDAVRADARLRELLTTPLMVNMAVSGFRDRPIVDLPSSATPDEFRQLLFDRYLERMLHEHRPHRTTSGLELQRCLTWMARMLQAHSQSLFFFEQLQPDWLELRGQAVYRRLFLPLLNFTIGALVSIAVSNMFGFPDLRKTIVLAATTGILGMFLTPRAPETESGVRGAARALGSILATAALVAGVVAVSALLYLGQRNSICCPLQRPYTLADWRAEAAVYGAGIGLLTVALGLLARTPLLAARSPSPSSRFIDLRRFTMRDVRNALVVAVLVSVAVAATDALGHGTGYVLRNAPGAAVDYGIVTMILSMVMSERTAGIRPVEVFVVSWRGVLRHLTNLRLVWPGLLFAAAAVLANVSGGLPNQLPVVRGSIVLGLIVFLVYLLAFHFYSALAGDLMPDRGRIEPNVGMHRSARNALVIGIGAACVGWSINVLGAAAVGGPQSALHAAVTYALGVGGATGLVFGLLYGGEACSQHTLLRLLLAVEGWLPFRAVRLLNEAESRILLRRVGGGYAFMHDLFRDHLATMDRRGTDPLGQ